MMSWLIGTGRRRSSVWLLVVVMIAGSCSTTATVDGDNPQSSTETATSVGPPPAPAEGGEPAESDPGHDPRNDHDAEDQAGQEAGEQQESEPQESEDSSARPTPEPAAGRDGDHEPVTFRTDSIHGISLDGRFAYAGTSSRWNNPSACDSPAQESLAVVEIANAADGSAVAGGAGIVEAGDIEHLSFGPDGQLALVSSCQRADGGVDAWVAVASVGAAGVLDAIGARVPIEASDGSPPFPVGWLTPDAIVLQNLVLDENEYHIDQYTVSFSEATVVAVERHSEFEDVERNGFPFFTTPDGRFTYTEADDPSGEPGCEGGGLAGTLEVNDGSGTRLALGPSAPTFAFLEDMRFGGDGTVIWTSSCEGFSSVYAGRILEDGSLENGTVAEGVIVDAHWIDTTALAPQNPDGFVAFTHHGLTEDGVLVAVGVAYGGGDETTDEVVFLRHDLDRDPFFVVSASNPPAIEADPVASSLDALSAWHRGDSLGQDLACGGSTLYADTASGFVRAFPAGQELDRIVEIEVSGTHVIEFGDGDSYATRIMVLETECPADYEGRRIWFSVEPESVRWGLHVEEADLGPVADVRSVRQVLDEDGFVDRTLIEIEQLDGQILEVELNAVAAS